ncbi:MAG: TauD/TfdA family dioxygenase, partial [Steroidobacteraceae bacterium]
MPRLYISSANELTLELDGGQRFALHPLWLRERCRDVTSMDLRTGQRLHDPSDLDLDLAVVGVSEIDPGCYRVGFSDGHQADFLARDILDEAALAPGDHDMPLARPWTAANAEVQRFPWVVQPDDTVLAKWLGSFLEFGFVIFSGVPTEPRTVLQVARTFGFTRETNFGALFDVRSTPEASDLAYTSLPLDPHTDNPYRHPVPGVQLLHCLRNQTSGGLSTLVDGFAAAQALQASDPEAFQLLARTPVRFRYQDEATELVASAPSIQLDVTG